MSIGKKKNLFGDALTTTSVRLSSEMYDKAKQKAHGSKISLNAFLVNALASYMQDFGGTQQGSDLKKEDDEMRDLTIRLLAEKLQMLEQKVYTVEQDLKKVRAAHE